MFYEYQYVLCTVCIVYTCMWFFASQEPLYSYTHDTCDQLHSLDPGYPLKQFFGAWPLNLDRWGELRIFYHLRHGTSVSMRHHIAKQFVHSLTLRPHPLRKSVIWGIKFKSLALAECWQWNVMTSLSYHASHMYFILYLLFQQVNTLLLSGA